MPGGGSGMSFSHSAETVKKKHAERKARKKAKEQDEHIRQQLGDGGTIVDKGKDKASEVGQTVKDAVDVGAAVATDIEDKLIYAIPGVGEAWMVIKKIPLVGGLINKVFDLFNKVVIYIVLLIVAVMFVFSLVMVAGPPLIAGSVMYYFYDQGAAALYETLAPSFSLEFEENQEFRVALMDHAEVMIASGELPAYEYAGLMERAYANDLVAQEQLGEEVFKNLIYNHYDEQRAVTMEATRDSLLDRFKHYLNSLLDLISETDDPELKAYYRSQLVAVEHDLSLIEGDSLWRGAWAQEDDVSTGAVADGINDMGVTHRPVGEDMNNKQISFAQEDDLFFVEERLAGKIEAARDNMDSCWLDWCVTYYEVIEKGYIFNAFSVFYHCITEGCPEIDGQMVQRLMEYLEPPSWMIAQDDDWELNWRSRAWASNSVEGESSLEDGIQLPLNSPGLQRFQKATYTVINEMGGYLGDPQAARAVTQDVVMGRCQLQPENNAFTDLVCGAGSEAEIYLQDEPVSVTVDGEELTFNALPSGECNYASVPPGVAVHVKAAVEKTGVDCGLLLATLTIENGGHLPEVEEYSCATSSAGARGYGQIMPGTWDSVKGSVGPNADICDVGDGILASAYVIKNKIVLNQAPSINLAQCLMQSQSERRQNGCNLLCTDEDGVPNNMKIEGVVDNDTEVKCLYEMYNGSPNYGDVFLGHYLEYKLDNGQSSTNQFTGGVIEQATARENWHPASDSDGCSGDCVVVPNIALGWTEEDLCYGGAESPGQECGRGWCVKFALRIAQEVFGADPISQSGQFEEFDYRPGSTTLQSGDIIRWGTVGGDNTIDTSRVGHWNVVLECRDTEDKGQACSFADGNWADKVQISKFIPLGEHFTAEGASKRPVGGGYDPQYIDFVMRYKGSL